MECGKTILPGITSIGYALCADLPPAIPFTALAGCPVDMPEQVISVPFSGSPTCEAVASTVDHGQKETVTLQFATACRLPHHMRLAFVVGTADGQRYLIGAKEPPFPICEVSFSTGSAEGDPAVSSVKVTCKSVKALARIGF